MPYRILSLDGGGVRGVLSAGLLERLDAVYPGFVARADLIAGTSTGGILALGLADGLTPAECRAFYEQFAPQVFPRRGLYRFGPLRLLRQTVLALYGNRTLRRALAQRFEGRTLASLRQRVLICAFDLDSERETSFAPRSWKAKFFHNFPDHPDQPTDANARIVDVALSTSAGPTYLPVHAGFVDGGVVANNPAMCAVAQARNPATGGRSLDELVVLSIGSGQYPEWRSGLHNAWGIAQWALPAPRLTDLFINGGMGLAEYQCRNLLPAGRFHRLSPSLERPVNLDESDKIPWLREAARRAELRDLRATQPPANTLDWLGQYWQSG